MKIKQFSLFALALALTSVVFFSCEEHKYITPELTVPYGAEVDYFDNTIDFGPEGGSKTIKFETNVDWEISPYTQSSKKWSYLSRNSGVKGPSSVTINVKPNETGIERNLVYTLYVDSIIRKIKIFQEQNDIVIAKKHLYNVGIAGGTIDVSVNENVFKYAHNNSNDYFDYYIEYVSGGKDWITPSKGTKTRGLITHNYSFDIAKSEEYDKRTGLLIFTSKNTKEADTVKVVQSGSKIMVLDQNDFTVEGNGGQVEVDMNTNIDFELDMPNVDWIHHSQTRGVSSHHLVFDIDRNPSYKTRKATIVVHDKRDQKRVESITIRQLDGWYIGILSEDLQLGVEADTFAVNVKSSVDYEVSIPKTYKGKNLDWLKVYTPSNSAKHRAVTKSTRWFRVTESKEYDVREGIIYFSYKDLTDSLMVYQSGSTRLVLARQFTNPITGSDTTISVVVKHNIAFKEPQISVDWITPVNTRSVSSTTKSFNVAPNKTNKNRSGKITFVTDNDADGAGRVRTESVTVTQKPIVRSQSLNIVYDEEMEGYVGKSYKLHSTSLPENAYVESKWESEDENVFTVTGSGRYDATIKATGYGSAKLILKDENSDAVKEELIHTRVTGFAWNSTDEKHDKYNMLTIAVGETEQLEYSTKQGTFENFFSDWKNDFIVKDEAGNVITNQSFVSIEKDGSIKGLKKGIFSIEPTGYIEGSADEAKNILYINVIKEYEETEPNDDFANANRIKYGWPMRFKFIDCITEEYEMEDSDPDFFKFTSKGQKANLTIKYYKYSGADQTFTNQNKKVSYEIYNANKAKIKEGVIEFDKNGEEKSIGTIDVANNSTIYIKVYTDSDLKRYPNGDFQITVNDPNASAKARKSSRK